MKTNKSMLIFVSDGKKIYSIDALNTKDLLKKLFKFLRKKDKNFGWSYTI